MSTPFQAPPIPSVAFSEGSASLTASQLSEAVISPKKEKESSFKIRRRTPSSTVESSPRLTGPNYTSPYVAAIVGTREKMETWLRDSGPGSSCLWIQIEDFSVESRRKALSGQLKLSYRLRSEQSLSLPLLDGTLTELSPVAQKQEFKRVTKKSVREILFPEGSDMVSLRSKSQVGDPKQVKFTRAADIKQPVNFVTSEKAYRQLLQMVSPGGVLREYQSLLRRAADSTSFIDVDFQVVDLQKWLKQHPFAIFWEETDVVIVRKEAENLKWTLLRFDFGEGLIRSTQGTTLFALESTFRSKANSNVHTSEKSWRGDQIAYDAVCKAREKELEDKRSKLEWKTWNNISSGQNCSSVSPLNLILIDILGTSATVSAAEIESVKFLFNSGPCERSAPAQEEDTGSAIQTIFTCLGRKRLSAKEKHALTNLKSESKDVTLEGICTLLGLLLQRRDETAFKSCSEVFTFSMSPPSPLNLDSSRSSSNSFVWVHSDQEDSGFSLNAEKKREDKYGQAAENRSASSKVGDQTDPAQKTSQGWYHHREHGNVPIKKDEATEEVGVMQLIEWVKCGFLESLVEKILAPSRCLQPQESKIGKALQLSFDRVVDACMKVMELLPGEGSSRMVTIILGLLHELLETIGNLSCTVGEESRKEGEKVSSNKSLNDSSLPVGTKSGPWSPDSRENKLQEAFATAVRFSRLLSAVISRSSILAGTLTVSGGLDLILDFYSCLLKRFPLNLRLGAKSITGNYWGDGVLPGEVPTSQVAPLRVLPCIFPSLCICKVSKLCLMDCCIYPVEEKVDLMWITGAGDSSCLLKQFTDGFEKLTSETCNNAIEKILTLAFNSRSNLQGVCSLTSRGNQNPEFLTSKGEETLVTRAPQDMGGNKDSEIPELSQQRQSRPYVPRLTLSSMQGSNSKSAHVVSEGFRESSGASLVCTRDLISSENSGPSSHFDIFKAVSDVKYELLRSIATLFGARSLSFMRIRGYLHQRLQDDQDAPLVLALLPDMIGGFVNTAPEYNVLKMKKVLLQIVSLLDKSECPPEGMNLYRQKDANGGPRWNGPGPPPALNDYGRAVDILLMKIGERLTSLVSHLTEVFTKSEAYEKDAISKQTLLAAGSDGCCEPSVVTKIFYSGHMLSLWVDVGILLKSLGDFVLLWPEGGSARLVLKSCAKPIERVVSFLAKSIFCQSGWNLPQILAMQYLFRLSTASMTSTAQETAGGSPQIWSEVDEFFWQLFIVSESNWTNVKNFSDWILQKSCQGCVNALVEGYQRVLWEPLEIYHSILGHKVYPPWARRNSPDCSPRGETLRKSILSFLRTSVMLIKKKLKCQSESSQASPVLYMSRLIFLLDFLMNPVDGLLMSVLKAPVTCDELNRIQNDIGADTLPDRIMPQNIAFNCISDSAQSANMGSNADNMGGLCINCGVSASFQICTPSMKHECISMLADIFSLKAFQSHDEQTNLCINPRAQNPFLFRKYVNPFLEIISLCFLKCYNDRVEHKERERLLLWFTSPSMYRNCILQRNGPVDSPEFSLDGRNEFGACSDGGNDDQAASVACIQYARILLALAQNQTEDVSRAFQQARIMDFLVQQIGLEYEVSQVATPRETVQAGKSNGTPLSSAKLKIQSFHDPEVKALRPVHIRREERSNSKDLSTIVEGESIQKELSENMGADASVKYNRVCISSSKSTTPKAIFSSEVVLLKPESQPCGRPSHTSRRISEEQTLSSDSKLVPRSCLKKSNYCLGFHSARDIQSISSANYQPYWILLDQPLLNFHQKTNKWQGGSPLSEEIPKNLRPSGEKSRNTLNPVLSERGTTSTWTLSQRGRGVSANFSSNFLGKSENYKMEHPARNRRDAVPFTPQVKVSPSYSPTADVQGTTPAHNHVQNTGSMLKEVKYSGRFFDLNEEVERELARENSPVSVDHITERTESSNDSEQLLDNSLQRDTVSDHENMQFTLVSTGTSSRQPKATSRGQDVAGTIAAGGNEAARPAIPRLKLPKSVRKGGHDVIPDTSMNLEFLLSTTSTQESNGRLNSLLELQKEFTSDRDDGSWMFGSYETKRLRRRLYRHAGLHVLLMELYIALMLNTQGSLEACYSDRFPMENRKINAPFFLSYHLNHAANSYLLPCLSKRMKDFKPAAYRILKLTWRALFTPLLYRNRIRIAHGAFAQVYLATVRGPDAEDRRVVLKVIDVPKGPYDPCRFFDVFSEVEILERFVDDPRVCQILDYGVESESFVLVLKHYKCSLRTWRERQNNNSNSVRRSDSAAGVQQQLFHKTLPLYLEVYSAVIQAVKVLAAENVVHYDLKCDNILLEPVDPPHPESEFWTPVWPPLDTSNPLPFRVCVADFGQSKASSYIGGECTVRNRGTEYVKSPEMLKLLSSRPQQSSDSNIRQVEGAVGKAVDIWSLGCLLYELLTGEYLLYDDDWLRFFIRVTVASEELIPEHKAAKLDNYRPVLDLLRFILVRDPIQRPTLDDLITCVEQLQLKILEQPMADNSKPINDSSTKGVTCAISDEETGSESSSESDGESFEPPDVVPEPDTPEQGRSIRALPEIVVALATDVLKPDIPKQEESVSESSEVTSAPADVFGPNLEIPRQGHPFSDCLMCLNCLLCGCLCVRE
ncbi:hypothetical protein R1flu_003798 [Riccia fluitans]|uniref:Protein kinase domain-containing protein n=1 Tax=Riccia fluitans TaxID=41844 RepID=A0ABD1YA04_9MARC